MINCLPGKRESLIDFEGKTAFLSHRFRSKLIMATKTGAGKSLRCLTREIESFDFKRGTAGEIPSIALKSVSDDVGGSRRAEDR